MAAAAGVPPMLIDDGTGQGVPLVDLQGRIRDGVGPLPVGTSRRSTTMKEKRQNGRWTLKLPST